MTKPLTDKQYDVQFEERWERATTPTGCDCEGPLHYTTCWWCVSNDDGRDQATGDPRIDNQEDDHD